MRRDSTPLIFTGRYAQFESDCACPDKAFHLHFAPNSASNNDDCACPDVGFVSTQIEMNSGRYVQTAVSHTTPLPNGFHLAYSPFAPGGPSILNKATWERWQNFAQPMPIGKQIDTELAQQMLIHPADYVPRPQPGQPETLTAWMHITNACNLDCPYCYVRKSSERMSEKTGLDAVDSLFRTAQKHGYRQVKLKYAGGEATLHFKLVQKLHQRAIELSEQTGITLKEVVLSNGVHIRQADAHWLAENDVKLMISLDGIGELHNQLRPLPTHTPFDTFSQIAKNIDNLLLPLGIKPDISMTITAVNAAGAADMVKWAMIDRDLPLSFNFYRQNNLSATHTELALEEESIIQGMQAAYRVIEKHLPLRPFLNGLLDRVQTEAHTHTCGVGQNYLVITHTGQLAQCQMHLEQPVATSLNQDLLLPIQQGTLHNLSVHDKEECRTCEFRYRCSGGCPLETYRATGRWDVKSPNCHIYKTLYPEALRLEGLRLMKLHGYMH